MAEDDIDEVTDYTKSTSPSATSTPHELTPRGSMRATLMRIGAKVEPEADDEASLRGALRLALLDSERVKMPLLRGVLFERGGTCKGCIERTEYVEAIFSSLHKPLVGRHGLPLFLYDAPLFPHTLMGLNLYEPRYKLLCRRALKVERLFGFVTGEVGVLARMVTVAIARCGLWGRAASSSSSTGQSSAPAARSRCTTRMSPICPTQTTQSQTTRGRTWSKRR